MGRFTVLQSPSFSLPHARLLPSSGDHVHDDDLKHLLDHIETTTKALAELTLKLRRNLEKEFVASERVVVAHHLSDEERAALPALRAAVERMKPAVDPGAAGAWQKSPDSVWRRMGVRSSLGEVRSVSISGDEWVARVTVNDRVVELGRGSRLACMARVDEHLRHLGWDIAA